MSMVKDIMIENLKKCAADSMAYKELIDTAKTKTKSKFYTKKLKKNNELAFRLVKALEKLK